MNIWRDGIEKHPALSSVALLMLFTGGLEIWAWNTVNKRMAQAKIGTSAKVEPVKQAPVKQIKYPYVDQVNMSLTLPPDEIFVSISSRSMYPGYFTLVTKKLGSTDYKVYYVTIADSGVEIEQPGLFFTIKEK